MRNLSVIAVATTCQRLVASVAFQVKALAWGIVPAVICITLPVDAFAKIDSAILEKQRAANKAWLEQRTALRTGKWQKESVFRVQNVETVISPSLKLDAIPPSPRRRARTTL